LKEGTLRVRILPIDEEDGDFIKDAEYFFLGKDVGGFISPSVFGDEDPMVNIYNALKASSDEDNQELAKEVSPKKKGLIFVISFKDDRGKELDKDNSERWVLLTNGLQQEIIDYYLDEEWGDMTDPDGGYDIKLKREGKGKMDTTYSCAPAKNTELHKDFYDNEYDLDEELKKVVPTYEEILEKVETRFGMTYEEMMEAIEEGSVGSGKKISSDLDEDDEDDRPKKKLKKKKLKKRK